MKGATIDFPAAFSKACADIIEFAGRGGQSPPSLSLVEEWLAGDAWGKFTDQWDGSVVLDTTTAPYNDSELRSYLDLEGDKEISNNDRINFCKYWLSEAMESDDSLMFPSLHCCKIVGKDGKFAFVACTASYGQGAVEAEWHGAFKDEADIKRYLISKKFDVDIDPNKIDENYIKKYWDFDY